MKPVKANFLQSNLFKLAEAYVISALNTRETGQSAKNFYLAAPMIMCQSFAVELLLKFFLATDHPSATTVDDLKKDGVNLKCHKYSELFDQLLPETKDKIANKFAELSGKQASVKDFRDALIAQGDEPFVDWRYIYEKKDNWSLDINPFDLVTNTLRKAAKTELGL